MYSQITGMFWKDGTVFLVIDFEFFIVYWVILCLWMNIFCMQRINNVMIWLYYKWRNFIALTSRSAWCVYKCIINNYYYNTYIMLCLCVYYYVLFFGTYYENNIIIYTHRTMAYRNVHDTLWINKFNKIIYNNNDIIEYYTIIISR